MKKIALILAMLMSVSAFAACGDKDDDDDKKSSSPAYEMNDDSKKKDKDDSDKDEKKSDKDDEDEKKSNKDDEDEKKSDKDDEDEKKSDDDDNSDEDGDDSDEDETESATEKTLKAANGTNFERGTVNGDVYSSDYSGFQFTLPSGWDFMSDEDVLATMNIGLDMTDAKDMTAELLDQLVIYDAVASNSLTGESIMVMYENISKTVPNPDSFTVEDYFDSAVKSASQLMDGVTLTGSDKTEAVDIGGVEYLKYDMNISYDSYGLELTQTSLGRKIDNFIFVVCYSSGIDGGSISDYMNCFDSLD